jgi:SAM-dependent methyltransferase
MTFADAKQRFSSRVADYVRYRPGYPSASIDLLRNECGLRPDHVVADIGSGTGLLSKLFLENGNRVFGVEPNEEMRQAGEGYLSAYAEFSSVNGASDATTLPDASVDFITAAQAFHWFEPTATRKEFLRILKPKGCVVVVWNDRRISETPFGRAYEDLLVRYGTDYKRVKEAYPEMHDMENFFGRSVMDGVEAQKKHRSEDPERSGAGRPLQEPNPNVRRRELPNFQEFDFDGLAGRLCSSSYAPKEGHANYERMMAALGELFDANQKLGRVRMDYATQIYFGRLDALRNSR